MKPLSQTELDELGRWLQEITNKQRRAVELVHYHRDTGLVQVSQTGWQSKETFELVKHDVPALVLKIRQLSGYDEPVFESTEEGES